MLTLIRNSNNHQMNKLATYLVVLVHTLHLTFAVTDYYVPYMVSLQKDSPDNELQHYCGGSLISPSHVLTSAYCCNGLDITTVYVRVGLRDLKEWGGQIQQALWCKPHDNYTLFGSDDIAILGVPKPFVLDGYRTATIYAEGTDYLYDGIAVFLYGWNPSLKYDPNPLQMFDFKTLNNTICLTKTKNKVLYTDLCAENLKISFPTVAFSGSPLVVKTSLGVTQVGIFRQRTSLEPGIFIRTSQYTSCIESISVNDFQID